MTKDSRENRGKHPAKSWFFAILITLFAFYLMNHAVMSMQGLPLSWNLSPAQ